MGVGPGHFNFENVVHFSQTIKISLSFCEDFLGNSPCLFSWIVRFFENFMPIRYFHELPDKIITYQELPDKIITFFSDSKVFSKSINLHSFL